MSLDDPCFFGACLFETHVYLENKLLLIIATLFFTFYMSKICIQRFFFVMLLDFDTLCLFFLL